jgi:hypothetical protein
MPSTGGVGVLPLVALALGLVLLAGGKVLQAGARRKGA